MANDTSREMDESSLCLACGLCCSGSIFHYVPLTAGDDPGRLAALGIMKSGDKAVPLPCAALTERSCGIYADRPVICREFRCELLKNCAEGKLTMQEAKEKIASALAMKEGLTQALSGGEFLWPAISLSELWKQLNALANGPEGGAFRRQHGLALAKLAAFSTFLKRHFYDISLRQAGSPSRSQRKNKGR